MLGGVRKLLSWIRFIRFVIKVTLQRAWLKARLILAKSEVKLLKTGRRVFSP